MEHVVGGLGRYSPPTWRPDPEFDLDQHLRISALPAPGSMQQLLDTVTRIYQDPYDRTRPLWMMHVIGGLEGGRAAWLWKIHHSVADGTGAARLSELFIQPTREAPQPIAVDLRAAIAAAVEADAADPQPSLVESAVGTATHLARRQAGIARRVVGEVAMWGADPRRAVDAVGSAARTVGQLRDQITGGGGGQSSTDDAEPQLPGGSPLWRSRSRHRHLEVLSFPLDAALAASKGLGGSLNDWFVTGVVNGGVAYHEARGVPLRTLNTSFVVSTRADKAIGGNSFTPTRFAAPAGPMDPAARFTADQRGDGREAGPGVRRRGVVRPGRPGEPAADVARDEHRPSAGGGDGLRHVQPAQLEAARTTCRGPRSTDSYAFGPLAGTAFNITAMSYAGQFGIGLFMDPTAIDDVGRPARRHRSRLPRAHRARHRRRADAAAPRHGLSAVTGAVRRRAAPTTMSAHRP